MPQDRCQPCQVELQALTIPLRLVQEGVAHDVTTQAFVCPVDDRHDGFIAGSPPRLLASGAIRRLAFWGAQDQQTRAKGLARPS